MKCRNTNASRSRKNQPPELFYEGIKVGILKNFAIFTENHLYWSLFLIAFINASVFL